MLREEKGGEGGNVVQQQFLVSRQVTNGERDSYDAVWREASRHLPLPHKQELPHHPHRHSAVGGWNGD